MHLSVQPFRHHMQPSWTQQDLWTDTLTATGKLLALQATPVHKYQDGSLLLVVFTQAHNIVCLPL